MSALLVGFVLLLLNTVNTVIGLGSMSFKINGLKLGFFCQLKLSITFESQET